MGKTTKQNHTIIRINKLFLLISSLSLLFSLTIAFDLIPVLRGPAPYPPEWQWGYVFANTLHRIGAPAVMALLLAALLYKEETDPLLSGKYKLLLFPLVLMLGVLFEMSLLYYSGAGIPVLIHRIINPSINSYFTAAQTVQNIPHLLHNYNDLMVHFVYHAQTHPPGSVIFFYLINQFFTLFPAIGDFASQFGSSRDDVSALWNLMTASEKATVMFSSIFIPLLTTLGAIPLYSSAKRLYDKKTALRSAILFLLIPGIVFFIPISDAFLALFSVTAFYFLVKGIQEYHQLSFFLSGLILFLGVFFNLALLPFLIFYFFYTLFSFLSKKTHRNTYFICAGAFSLGFFLPPILLFLLLQFNFIEMIQTIFRLAPHANQRSYLLWLPFNLLDFFIFTGIPAVIVYFIIGKQTVSTLLTRQWKKTDFLFLSFTIMLFLLTLSGSVRGEAGRIWAPYMPFIILLSTAYLTTRAKFSSKLFTGVLLLQALQILIMQQVWVMLY